MFQIDIARLAGLGLAATLAGEAAAQDALALGPFELDASAVVSGGYTDNVYSTEADKRGDFFSIFAPQLELVAEGENHRLAFGAEAEILRYASETSENQNNARLSAEGRLDLTERSFVFGGAEYAWDHEDRSSPEDVAGVEPTPYTLGSAFAGASHDFGSIAARLGANIRQLDFDDVRTGTGAVVNNDDRDRTVGEYGGRLSYELSEARALFLQALYEDRRYDESRDDFGYERGSHGFQAGVGAAGALGEVEGEAMIGVLSQNYDDPRFDTVTAPDFAVRAAWRPNPLTLIRGTLERSLEESTLYDNVAARAASGYLSTSAGLRASRRLAPDLAADGWAWFTRNDYQNVTRTDDVLELGYRLRWHFTQRLFLSGTYAFAQRSSDAAGADYDSHTVLLSLGAALQPEYAEGAPVAGLNESGFYAGLQGGHGALVTSVDGPRGNGGRLTADFGDHGFTGGVFAGWRGDFSGLVAGVEIDGELSGQDWDHDGARTFSVGRDESLGLSVLAGVRTLNDALLYARAGAVAARFDVDYSRAATGHDASEAEDLVGLRGGLGLEIPLSGALSGRMEYLLTAWPDHDVSVGNGADNFSTAEGLARLGLVYSFGGGEAPEEEAAAPADFDGFYAGGHVGHGTMVTENSGPRSFGILDVQRAGHSYAAGVHAGYGRTFGDFYLGGEVEAELSAGDWNIERSPDRRIYSMTNRGTLGASIRAGWTVGDAFLVYGRAGGVVSRFDTDYQFAGAAYESTDDLVGLRIGGGVQAPISDTLDVRFDYTHTTYEDFDLDYGAGVDRFEPQQNLFRIGVTKRF